MIVSRRFEQGQPDGNSARTAVWLLVLFTIVLAITAWPWVRCYLQAAAVLQQLRGHPVPRLLRPIAAMPVTDRTLSVSAPVGTIAARLYTPVSRPHAPGFVLIPGIHYLGIDEPRLIAFARSLAGCGLRVLTPELPGSRDYQISPDDLQAIGSSVAWLRKATGHRTGLMGLSFSGGLALMTAATPAYSDDVSFVFSVGAHDDMYRVATFYATGADPLPGGDVERAIPNPYGPMILEYEHLEDFTSAQDTAAIRPVLRAHLHENTALEARLLAGLTAAQKAEYERILDTPHEALALSSSNKKHAAEMAAVSPHGHLIGLHTPVYVLHGRGDTLIPFAEAEWLREDLPRGTVKEVLITPLIGHVTAERNKPALLSEWRLIRLLAEVLEKAERT